MLDLVSCNANSFPRHDRGVGLVTLQFRASATSASGCIYLILLARHHLRYEGWNLSSSWMEVLARPMLILFIYIQYKDSGGVISFNLFRNLYRSTLYLMIYLIDRSDCFDSLTCKVF